MRQESLKGCLTTYEHASVIDGLFSLYWDAGCILDKTPFNSVISILLPYLEIFMPRSAFDRKLSIVLLNCDVRYHNCNSRVFMFQQKCPTCNCLILMMMSSLKLQCLRCPSSRHLLQPVILVSNDIFVHRLCFWRFGYHLHSRVSHIWKLACFGLPEWLWIAHFRSVLCICVLISVLSCILVKSQWN